jgi:hypothetical protein
MVRDYYLWALKECNHDVAIRVLEWPWEHLGRPSNTEGILLRVVEHYKLSMVQCLELHNIYDNTGVVGKNSKIGSP